MSIFRRVSFLGFALVSLVVLAACGGDGDGGDGAFQLPPPGEYSFEVIGTMEIEFLEPGVSAAPLALQGAETVQYEGSLRISLGENGSFTLLDKDGLILRLEEVPEGPITLTDNGGSGGTISNDGMEIELNVLAELRDGVTTTHQQPFLLEGDGDPFSDEGVTLSPPADAESVRFMPVEGHSELSLAVVSMFMQELDDEFPPPGGETDEPPPDDDDALLEFSDPPDDATDCATGAAVGDPAVDIEGVNVRKVGEKIEVEVRPVQSPTISFEEAYSMAVIVLLFGWEGLLEIHAGERRQGQTDSSGNVIPGTEGDVTVTDDAVTFAIPNGESIPKGSLLEIKAFHMGEEGDAVNCDTFMTEYTCFGRCDD